TVRPLPSVRPENSTTHPIAAASSTTTIAPTACCSRSPLESNGGPRLIVAPSSRHKEPWRIRGPYGPRSHSLAGARSFLPEELPGIPLEVADHLLDVVVDLLVDDQRAGGALAALDVGHDHLRVGGDLLGAIGERGQLVERLDQLVALARPDDRGEVVDAVERLLGFRDQRLDVAAHRGRERLDVGQGVAQRRGVAD